MIQCWIFHVLIYVQCVFHRLPFRNTIPFFFFFKHFQWNASKNNPCSSVRFGHRLWYSLSVVLCVSTSGTRLSSSCGIISSIDVPGAMQPEKKTEADLVVTVPLQKIGGRLVKCSLKLLIKCFLNTVLHYKMSLFFFFSWAVCDQIQWTPF